jgi:hypothetical protein
MKKWFIVAGGILILLFAGIIYVWIPSNIQFTNHLKVACNARGGLRVVADSASWKNWVPEKRQGVSYHVLGQNNYITYVRVDNKNGDSLISRLMLVPSVNQDTMDLYWDFVLPTGRMPLSRIERCLFGRAVAGDMVHILPYLRDFLEKKENVYGLNIREASTTDSFLVATHVVFNADPTTEEINDLLGGLRRYISKGGAHETGYPMLNVTKLGDGRRQVETAVPIDKQLKGEGGIYSRKLVPGRYLVAEIKGGTGMIKRALNQMQNYVDDYQRTVMAIPFQSLVTDRSKERDTARWVTRLYYPVY